MGEVDGSLTVVCVDTCHRCLVAFKQVQDTGPGAVSAGSVDRPLLAAHYEVVDVVLREGEAGDGHRLALFVLQLQGLLRLRQHVQRPAAHLPVRADGDQVVSVLGSDHPGAVDWVGVGTAQAAPKFSSPPTLTTPLSTSKCNSSQDDT